MHKVLYIPLDERPCNSRYPSLLAEMTEDIELLVPPLEDLGRIKEPADVDKLWDWVMRNSKGCSYAILSIDMLLYGNIINSRTHHRTKEECGTYLEYLKRLKEHEPDMTVFAFNLVARVANGNTDAEDPDYWKHWGTRIWEYSYLMDRIRRGHADKDESQRLEKLKEEIPGEYLGDFLGRREVDRYVNLSCLELVKDGIIDELVIPKDDTAEYGFAAMDQSAVAQKIFEEGIIDRVMVYPGADEVGSILFARVFNRINGYRPRVYTRYSSTLGPQIIPKYEDRPLKEGIKAQITSMGGVCVDSAVESDLLLAVHSPGKTMIESGEQYNKDVTYYSHANLHEFLRFIEHYIEDYQRPCGLADVAFCNGGDNEMMDYLNKKGMLSRISAYGGWNTAQNTIGVVLAHANICSYYSQFSEDAEKKMRSAEFLLRKIMEDWLFQSGVLHEMFRARDEFKTIDPYHINEHMEQVLNLIRELMDKRLEREMQGRFLGRRIQYENLRLPWNRVFETDFDLKLMD